VVILEGMGDEKGSPLGDLGRGIYHLYRAAKKTAQHIPTERIAQGAREVGRAVGNVKSTVEKSVTGRDRRAEIAVLVADVKDGELTVKQGRIAFGVLSELCDAVREGKCAHGTIRVFHGDGVAHLDADGDFGKADMARLRGIIAAVSLADLLKVSRR
jgi:hypothetical protein